ncbi:MAG: hypothetical protein SWH61_05515 [Thermodesulfobacteriota bacterium]|nr:hypothetical protein [Thermodesulfobacteriota bacterium]
MYFFHIAGRIGTGLETVTQLAGFDWRTNTALAGGFAAKEREAGSWQWEAFSMVFNTLIAFGLSVPVCHRNRNGAKQSCSFCGV